MKIRPFSRQDSHTHFIYTMQPEPFLSSFVKLND